FLVAEAMIEAGVLEGLPRDVAEQLVVQTLLGSATLLAQSDDGPVALRGALWWLPKRADALVAWRAAVTSPGGTTAAGLRELESAGVRAAILDAVSAATHRSREVRGRSTAPGATVEPAEEPAAETRAACVAVAARAAADARSSAR